MIDKLRQLRRRDVDYLPGRLRRAVERKVSAAGSGVLELVLRRRLAERVAVGEQARCRKTLPVRRADVRSGDGRARNADKAVLAAAVVVKAEDLAGGIDAGYVGIDRS